MDGIDQHIINSTSNNIIIINYITVSAVEVSGGTNITLLSI
jgi:hypothetical protein